MKRNELTSWVGKERACKATERRVVKGCARHELVLKGSNFLNSYVDTMFLLGRLQELKVVQKNWFGNN